MNNYLRIPEIGTIVKLEEDWTFALYNEYRNGSLMDIFLGENRQYDYATHGKAVDFVTLPKDTELRVDRVYIRAGLSNFSSITFSLKSINDPRFYKPGSGKKNAKKQVLKKIRFWTKLADVNTSKMAVIKDTAADDTQE